MDDKAIFPPKNSRIYSVTELTKYIRGTLEDAFGSVWVAGEISNFLQHSSGHLYFSIRDAGAVIKCAMFRRAASRLKFKPKDGMQALCFGSVSVYEARGDYQLIVEELEPRGIGALELAFQELKSRLAKEGLFDDAHKVPIPYLPARIGVVTSPTGAVIRDILNVSRRRFSNIEIIIFPVKVQGDGAKEEIADAISEFNRMDNIDVMIIGRGGGSLEDLWPFNEEVVARAIYDSEIPVISAVGHEVDFTIADFVADLRAPTPSAAAELVIPKKEDLVNSIASLKDRLRNSLTGRIDILGERLLNLTGSKAFREPLAFVTQLEQDIDQLVSDMTEGERRMISVKGDRFAALGGKLAALNPLAVLNRGYSVTMRLPGLAVVKSASSLSKGDIIETRLSDGSIRSKVE